MLGINRHPERQVDCPEGLAAVLCAEMLDPLPQLLGALPTDFQGSVWENNDELLAPITTGNVIASDVGLEEIAQFPQQAIASLMTQSVVALFEVVDVKQDGTQWS